MHDLGFLYVLANSAMQGMVKVGKTTRSPSERAAELSTATGLPTPFIVVYEQLFEDCTEAEAFVHTLLARKGFRVADNREFFNAPVNEVVRAITLAPGAIVGDVDDIEEEKDDLISSAPVENELDILNLSARKTTEPWESIFEEAECHHYGLDDFIRDPRQAMRLYKQAAKLGCLDAYVRLGELHYTGDEGVSEDQEKALEYYKEGARRGGLYCFWKMGQLFMHSGPSGHENGIKCIRLFIKGFKERDTTSKGYVDNDQLDSIALDAGFYYIHSRFDKWYQLPNDIWEFFSSLSARIARQCTAMANRGESSGGTIYPLLRKAAEYYQWKSTRINAV